MKVNLRYKFFTLVQTLILLFNIVYVLTEKCDITEMPCKCIFNNGTVIDLNPLTPNDNNSFSIEFLRIDSSDKESAVFFFNPCKSFSVDSNKMFPEPKNKEEACKNVFGCKVIDTSYPSYQKAVIRNNTNLKIDLSSDAIIYKADDSKLTVNLICDNSSTELKASIFSENNEYTMNLTSNCACGNGCNSKKTTTTKISTPVSPTDSSITSSPASSKTTSLPKSPKKGLSTGSILLITFFTLLIVYLVLGVAWNGICQGASGIEMIPNVQFWKEFPSLVTEGATYSVQCCTTRSRSSYNEVS